MGMPRQFMIRTLATGFAASLVFSSLAFSAAHAAAEKKEAPAQGALVMVTKAANACFSDTIRATGFVVPRKTAASGVDTEGGRVTAITVREGDLVTEGQELARITMPPTSASAQPPTLALRAPAPGLVIQVHTRAGAPASPQGGPMFRIAVNGELELDAEVPSVHLMKLSPGATARVSLDDGPEVSGRVRVIAPEIDRATQLGRVRLSLTQSPALKVGMFAKASIDARRSCGVSVPKSAIDHSTVQVVKDNTVETRRVKVGLNSPTAVEILEGVSEGEIVVANAGTSLHDGDRIRTMFPDDFERTRGR